MDKKRLTEKSRTGHGYPSSRDFALPEIPCLFRQCPANCLDKCTMPSVIHVNSEGMCMMAIKTRAHEKGTKHTDYPAIK